MRWYAGTSGYSYKEWKGSFYPEDLPADQMLRCYAERLSAVEINNTFYRMPRDSVLARWAEEVPADFRFAIKAPRRITHQQRLQDTAESTRYFVERLAALDGKLGAVLFQLPPSLRRDDERLTRFLDLLPPELPAAFEFRHPSWYDPAVMSLLSERAVALCVSEAEDSTVPEQIATVPWLYLRLRKPEYTDAALGTWLARSRASGALHGFAFFKHEDEAAGPAMACRFLELSQVRERKAPRAVGAGTRGTGAARREPRASGTRGRPRSKRPA